MRQPLFGADYLHHLSGRVQIDAETPLEPARARRQKFRAAVGGFVVAMRGRVLGELAELFHDSVRGRLVGIADTQINQIAPLGKCLGFQPSDFAE